MTPVAATLAAMATRGRPPRMSRAQQERELLVAARRVLDQRGFHGAQMDDIARLAGISKGMVYRHFESKDELHISVVVVYLDELGELLEAVPVHDDSVDELLELASVFLNYGIEHPAFLDCALALLRRPAAELVEQLPPATLLRVTQAMARSLRVLTELLERGRQTDAFAIDDPDAWANYWYVRALGSLHLARIGVIVCPSDSQVPQLRALDTNELRSMALEDMLADVGVSDPRTAVRQWRERTADEPVVSALPTDR